MHLHSSFAGALVRLLGKVRRSDARIVYCPHGWAFGMEISPARKRVYAAIERALARVDRRFLVFVDDLGFAPGDATGPRHLRSWLDGGVEARPGNVRLAVTSNRRAIVARAD